MMISALKLEQFHLYASNDVKIHPFKIGLGLPVEVVVHHYHPSLVHISIGKYS